MAPRPVPPPLQLHALPARPRSRTLDALDRPLDSRASSSLSLAQAAAHDDGDAWDLGDGFLGVPLRPWLRSGNASSSSLTSASGGNASDSAYGTLDEHEHDHDQDDDDAHGCFSPAEQDQELVEGWKDRLAETFEARSRRRVRAALGAEGWRLRVRTRSDAGEGARGSWRDAALDSAQSSPEVPHSGVFSFDLDYDADSSFDSLESLAGPSAPGSATTSSSIETSSASLRSSPEPSECGESDSAAARLTMARKRRKLLSAGALSEVGTGVLARRHTLPRRTKAREPAVKVAFASPRRDSRASLPAAAAPFSTPSSSSPASRPFLPPFTHAAASLTALVSFFSYLSPHPLVTPISPVAFRHASSFHDLAHNTANAALAPFLLQPSLRSAALGVANLALLKSLEESAPSVSMQVKGAVAATMWAAIVGLRVLAGWVFGRVLGWAHPQLFSTRAIHEVGSGLAPLLLALYLLRSATSTSTKPPSYLPVTILAVNFATQVSQGGAGLWLGICGAVVGLVASLVAALYLAVSRRSPPSPSPSSSAPPLTASSTSGFSLVHFLTLLTLPILAINAVAPTPSAPATSTAFSQLHPSEPHLLTVLLMTAPRPGSPDFLLQTVESWLGAFPEPDALLSYNSSTSLTVPSLSSRIRLVVYTHFDSHPVFDLAQSTFSSWPKAAHYITWHRDPRAAAAGNRLDQRLHVARGLEYAASLDGAYVLLTEDDFPLCEDGAELHEPGEHARGSRSWSKAWSKLEAALVATNALMPDVDPALLSSADPSTPPPPPGHCGLFLSTGGSGLAIRRPLAALLPSLLLGSTDPHGYAREAAAARGEVPAQVGGAGADTPDLVIQDCLRGRLEPCRALCAPAGEGGEGPFVAGSARLPGAVLGARGGKSGLAGTERLLQRHLGYNASTLPGREYGKEEWACGWRQPFNGELDVLTV
ncbi:hypothetical protein JCM8097_006310 [Rhodosporidiobolus ruineniae]